MLKNAILLLLNSYQKAASYLARSNCRFYPSCSQYTKEAVEAHGPLLGLTYGAKRILRCNQYFEGGFDPVPLTRK